MFVVACALTAFAHEREPTEAELAQSTIEFRRIFASAPTRIVDVPKVWIGTQHIIGQDLSHLGYIVTLPGSSDEVRIERWVTWGTPYTLADQAFGLVHLVGDLSWGAVVDDIQANHAGEPITTTEMTVEYKVLTASQVQAMSGAFLPGTKDLYTVTQDCPSDCGPAGEVDGWVLRVRVGIDEWQDHWTFADSFKIDEVPGVFPVVVVVPAENPPPIGFGARDYYSWAAGQGAINWSFVEHTVEHTTAAAL
jgi:hypothetical protein